MSLYCALVLKAGQLQLYDTKTSIMLCLHESCGPPGQTCLGSLCTYTYATCTTLKEVSVLGPFTMREDIVSFPPSKSWIQIHLFGFDPRFHLFQRGTG